MRPGMRHPSPAPPLRPPQRLMPAANDGGVFFGGRDYARRQQQQQHNYPPQKPLLPPGALAQQWPNNNNVNYRTGLMPLTRGGGVPNPGPWHPRANVYRPTSRPSPPPPLSIPSHHHPPPPPHQFNPNAQTPISYVPPSSTTYDLMRLAAGGDQLGQIPFLEPLEDEDALVRQHLASNNGGGSDDSLSSSPSKPNKRSSHRRQHEKNRNIISYFDLDRPDESRDSVFDNRIVPSKSNHLSSVVVVAEKSSSNHLSEKKSSTDNDQALKLELDRIKRAGVQEREKLKAQRQAAAEKEKEAQIKRNSVKTGGDNEKREDGELGDSSDDEHVSMPTIQPPAQKRLKKLVENTNRSIRSAKTPPSSSESVIDMSIMKLIRPMKLFRLDDNDNTSYRDYLTANYARVRVHCNKPQPNFFSNLSCIEEIKRRYRLNNPSTQLLSPLLRHLLDENDDNGCLLLAVEPEDGEIESDEEGTNSSKVLKRKSTNDSEKHPRKRSKLLDETLEQSKTTLSEKPWITTELRQLILQRNKLQAQILGGETNAEVEKKFKKMRNKICKHARTLKAKYENSVSDSAESTTTSVTPSTSAMAAAAAQHPLSSILDPALVMAMLVNPSLYSHVQQQVLSNPNFIQAYQHMLVDSSGTGTSLPKAVSETQVVPSTTMLDGLMKQTTTSKSSKEQQQQAAASARSRPVLTSATKPIPMMIGSELDNANAKTASATPPGKSRFGPNAGAEPPSIADVQQQQEIALTQELFRRQLAAQQRAPRHPHSSSTLSLSTPLSRHIPLTSEQMQEVLTRAKNYVTRQQSDETTDLSNNPPRLSYNTRRLQAAMAASASSATPQTAHAIGQAAAAAIAAVSARPSTKTASPTVPPPTVSVPPVPPVPVPSQQQQQQHPIRIQLDQKSKTLSSISNPQSLPIPTISQQKVMSISEVAQPPHMYPNPPNWQRPRLPVQHYPPPLGQPQHFAPLPYENTHAPYFGPRTNFPPDMRPPSYGPRPSHLSPPPPPPRHLVPPRYNGPLPPYGYGHPPPHAQNYGPPPLPPHPHYGHHYPPP